MLRHALERQDHAVLEARDQPDAVRLLKDPALWCQLSDNCFTHLHANSWDVWMPIINDILCNV